MFIIIVIIIYIYNYIYKKMYRRCVWRSIYQTPRDNEAETECFAEAGEMHVSEDSFVPEALFYLKACCFWLGSFGGWLAFGWGVGM